ncbi:unnamed protein product [Cuscuta campestris]|uniref:Uncharacterized protein n=1 Tax=Cuscuta campestris TaxID=132261 RepID=A0A484N671_9ASTE|nr:unnamed protein product [Cuscuta campestris]
MISPSTRTSPEPKPLLSENITASSSIPDVVEFLRSSFQAKDFILGKKLLCQRENSLKAELESVRNAKESAVKERDLEILKIREELKKCKSENQDLIQRNISLKREIEDKDNDYAKLEEMVGRLEEDIAAKGGFDPSTLATIYKHLDGELPNEEDGLNLGTQRLEPTPVVGLGVNSPKKEDMPAVVVLSDSEDELPLDSPSNCRKKMKYDEETEASKNSNGAKEWTTERQMCTAFAFDDELCMHAVCALYRKLISAPMSLKAVDRVFEPDDEMGVELAKYFIDGHPENNLKRSKLEASANAIKHSRKIAEKYIKQLFRIYTSGEDPLFCHDSVTTMLYSAPKDEI